MTIDTALGQALGQVLLGVPAVPRDTWTIEPAVDGPTLSAYLAIRRSVFVDEQQLFAGTDRDDADDDPRTVALVARDGSGEVLGGVRLHPATADTGLGWWYGGRLAVRRDARGHRGLGSALVRAACARAEAEGALRFEATVQAAHEAMFVRLGWTTVRPVEVAGQPHVLMRWGGRRFAALAAATKSPLGPLLQGLQLGGPGYVGDDGAPVPGSNLIAACDAIIPAMVERDPEWAGWCGVLVNVNDVSAMGATPVALLDAVAARDASFAARILSGLRRASEAYGVPVVGGHTQLGAPAALSVTAVGRTTEPVRAGGGRPGDEVTLVADLAGQWRPGYTGRQWDSTSHRAATDLRDLLDVVPRHRPAAAKDVSMAGVVGTLGMLAEASGTGAILDVAAVPRPAGTTTGDWLTCFPGFAMVTADRPGLGPTDVGVATSAVCGALTAVDADAPAGRVSLHWPDGATTVALSEPVTGLGPAGAL